MLAKTKFRLLILLLIVLFSALFYATCNAQATVCDKWQICGNYGTSNSSFIGTKDTFSLKFDVNSSEKMRLNNAGIFNVGGIISYPLLVADSMVNGTASTPKIISSSPTSPIVLMGVQTTDGTRRSRAALFQNNTNNLWGLSQTYNSGSSDFILVQGKYEQFRLKSNGNVGIGTKSPTQKLQVHGLVYSDTLGIKFPDATIQTTAATSGWSLNGNALGVTDVFGSTNDIPIRFVTSGSTVAYFGSIYDANVSLGFDANHNNSGTSNIAVGQEAMYDNSVGSGNVAVGYGSLHGIAGDENVAIGHNALSLTNLTTVFGNVAVGYNTGSTNLYGELNTFIGYSAGGTIDVSNSSAIGANSVVDANNQIRLGDANVTDIGGYAAWNNISDKRLKNVVSDTVAGLSFVMRLKPLQYYWKRDSIHELLHTGLLAQDVDSVANSIGFDFDGVVVPKDKIKGTYGIAYSQLVMPLIVAVQQQQKQIDELKKQINLLITNK